MSRDYINTLVVAEKPSVAEAFAKALADSEYRVKRINGVKLFEFTVKGERYASIGLKGHLFNYDFEEEYNSWDKIDPEELFYVKPIRVIEKSSKPYFEVLRKIVKNVENVFLALDADAEGESICFEVIDVIKSVNPHAKFKRLWFSSTIEEELKNSIRNPREPNRLLAEKCFTRMKTDLIIGATFTRLLTNSIRKLDPKILPYGRFLSYGPCQSPTLYLVVERVWEREKFKSKKFYTINAIIEIYGARYKAEYAKGRIEDFNLAKGIYDRIARVKETKVIDYKTTIVDKEPPKPLSTLELEARASRFLNIRAKNTLDIAEELYRAGYISYPRTETEVYSENLDLKSKLRLFINHPEYSEYSKKLLDIKEVKPTRGEKDDKAHPPIHPTKSATREEIIGKFGIKGWQIYDLVVRHFLATLSKEAKIHSVKVGLDIGGEVFVLRGQTILSLGYLEIYNFEKIEEEYIPELKIGEKFEVYKIELHEGETEPPPYLSEEQLLKLMEKYGIGTDATKQDHIHNNIERGYMYIEKKRCIPTPLGKTLIEALSKIAPEIVKPEVRGFMEKMFMQIANGERNSSEVLNDAIEYFRTQYIKVRDTSFELASKILPTIRESISIIEDKSKGRKKMRRPSKEF
ncbi:MAG: DNA topoisomerase [Candidatus Methanomethylicia archaeon]|nr:DNA topoisomerase [Candidatus Methanomethylicia archaeon]